MTRAIAPIAAPAHPAFAMPKAEMLRSIIVCSCALALILAGRRVPPPGLGCKVTAGAVAQVGAFS